jgi:2-hydroxychromene-2-carboxylate isomerase
LLPQRVLVYIKAQHSQGFIETFLDIFTEMWQKGVDVSKPELLRKVLERRFSHSQAQDIMSQANSPAYKQALNDNTKEALDRGAFGCPWYWVTNAKGQEEPFFGSDRYAPLSLRSLPEWVQPLGRDGRQKTIPNLRRCR